MSGEKMWKFSDPNGGSSVTRVLCRRLSTRFLSVQGEQNIVRQVAFICLTVGCRACVGRNLAMMEMRIVTASLFRRYSFVLERPDEQVSVRQEPRSLCLTYHA